MSKHKIPEGEDGQDKFAEMLRVMDTEHLIRFRWRLNKDGRKRMVEILTEEIEEREALEKEERAAKK
jgi:rRNA maturation endonuclease Nob1